MDEVIIERMIERNRLYLSPLQTVNHFDVLALLILLPMVGIVIKWSQNQSPVEIGLPHFGFILIYLSVLLIIYVLQTRQLRFRKLSVDLEAGDILRIINLTGESLKWTPKVISKHFIQADSIRILGADCVITIVIKDKDIYLNCRTKYGQFGLFRQEKILDNFESNLRMKAHEIKFQKERMEQVSR